MLAHLATLSECLDRDSFASVEAGSVIGNKSGGGGGGPGPGMIPYLWITCVLAALNAITNGFSLIVFALDRKSVSMRRLLLLLSLSETVLNICMSVNLAVMLSIGRERRFSNFPNVITGLFFLSFMLFNGYIMIRNWCLVMIAGSRCEAVRNPLSTRSGQIFSPSRTLTGYAVLSIVSLGVYTPRMFEFTWTVYQLPCSNSTVANNNSTVPTEYLLTTRVHHILDARPAYGYYKTMLLYPLQTILPIFLIAGLSFLIVVTLRHRRDFQQPQQQQQQPQGQTAARVSQDAATKTVMVLMLAFIVCELPTFVFFVLNRTVLKALPNYNEVRTHTTFIGNILVCLDSFSNFIIYSSTSNSFRDTVRRIFHLPAAAKTRRHHPANYMALRACDPRLSRASAVNAPLGLDARAEDTNAV